MLIIAPNLAPERVSDLQVERWAHELPVVYLVGERGPVIETQRPDSSILISALDLGASDWCA